ncbi:translational activator of cytochrome c oxidase 1 [Austrofundulus limnaeus]|uniref:Translational activator of cytochrome c oxidase 1 n=1 Tax=Austrofundulus limnaeus TaxID=52670 RepID=A0A2I4BNV8_AUSLI|nr:PREDICTED: translational activator of cytochrome c oxidase 1 [Austrofundulus limnaeus]
MVVLGTTLLRALRTLRPPTPAVAPVRLPVRPVLSPVWKWTCPVRTLQVSSAVHAGHNKWSKVRHIKGPKDGARSTTFHKLGMLLRAAVREGGANPEMNTSLGHILEQCRRKNMPKSTIDSAINSGMKPVTHQVFEVRGPSGCMLLVEVLSENSMRTNQEIRRLLNKYRGIMSDKARNNFIQKGAVVVSGENVTTEKALELAIEAGAEDVQNIEDEEEKPQLKFVCAVADLHKLRGSLESLGMEVTSAEFEYVPRNTICLDADQIEQASILIDALIDCPDVVHVWDNIQADS